MNTFLKIMAAIALISLTIAAGVFTIKTLTEDKPAVTPPVANRTEEDTPPVVTPIKKTPVKPIPKITAPVEVKRDDPLQPAYIPVNQPAYLQNIRTEGKTYHSRVIGKVEGKASKKDWGIRGSAHFTYVYGVESIGKILKNDGVTIIEERTFGDVIEDVIVSRYEVGFEIPPRVKEGFSILCGVVGAIVSGGSQEGADAGHAIGETVNEIVSEIRIPFTDKMFADLRKQDMLPEELDPEKVKKEMMMFTKAKDTRILSGKKVKITFRDGQGISRIDPIGCKLTQQEVDVIKRTNFVMDHYLFPDHKVAPGSKWEVNGNVFAGFLDPRLHGKVAGKVNVSRISDFTDAQGEIAKRLRLVNGVISFTDNVSGNQAVTGQLSGINGICSIPAKHGVVTSATMSGTMIYKNVSTDHLLFDAAMTVEPRFEIVYECEVK